MHRPPLGKVCIELGLLREEQVESILADMREHGQGRFGELAVGLNHLSEEDLARALAHQFGLTRLSAERVGQLDVPREVLALLPTGLMRSRVLLPTFYDPERRILSLVTSDPTDLPALQLAQRHARADRLRIFVAGRSAIAAHLDRLVPASDRAEATSPGFEALPQRSGTVVFEPDVELAAALRRLERAEGARTQIVPDPEQVTSLLTAGLVDRVMYRQVHQGTVAPYLTVWQRARPSAHVAAVRGFGPGRQVAVSHGRARAFYQELALWLLAATETKQVLERQRMRGAWRLATELAQALELREEAAELVSLAALLANVGELSLLGRSGAAPSGDGLGLYDEPAQFVARFAPPWALQGLYGALDRRVNRPLEVTEQLEVEALVAVRAAVEAGTGGHTLADEVLPDTTRFHPRVRDALDLVLQRRALRGQLLTGGRRRALVVLAMRDVALATELERRLEQAGVEVVLAPSVEIGKARTGELRPSAVVIGGRLPELETEAAGPHGPERLLAEIRHDAAVADTPVLCLAHEGEHQARAMLERHATSVLLPPFDLDVLVDGLLVALARPLGNEERSASATGHSALLTVAEVVDILVRSRQTAEVRLVAPEVQGTLNIVDGEVRRARMGRREGMPAWQLARELPHVRYAVAFGVRPEELDESDPASVSG